MTLDKKMTYFSLKINQLEKTKSVCHLENSTIEGVCEIRLHHVENTFPRIAKNAYFGESIHLPR